ncbi:hypothetical protein CEXT_177401 [Caerostris extrusa]|uniref:Uncharacterized protein n=1 Tax=Caerostris extrusa TaxID=172846 RepID=A0AAV4PDG6_CAEEX|nr:hypothetical protein CEXT_177401 [Caerostris extrusa]
MLPALPVALAASPHPLRCNPYRILGCLLLSNLTHSSFRLLLLVASFLITDMEASSVANRLGPGMTRMDRVMEYFCNNGGKGVFRDDVGLKNNVFLVSLQCLLYTYVLFDGFCCIYVIRGIRILKSIRNSNDTHIFVFNSITVQIYR